AVALIGALLGLAYGALAPKKAKASATVLLAFPIGTDPAAAIVTDAALLQTHAVAEQAAEHLGLNMSAAEILSTFHGTVVSEGVLRITATGPTPAEAARRANEVTSVYLSVREADYGQQSDATEQSLQKQIDVLERDFNQTNDVHERSLIDGELGTDRGL